MLLLETSHSNEPTHSRSSFAHITPTTLLLFFLAFAFIVLCICGCSSGDPQKKTSTTDDTPTEQDPTLPYTVDPAAPESVFFHCGDMAVSFAQDYSMDRPNLLVIRDTTVGGMMEYEITDATTIDAVFMAFTKMTVEKTTDIRTTDFDQTFIFVLADGDEQRFSFEAQNLYINANEVYIVDDAGGLFSLTNTIIKDMQPE